MTYNSWKLMDKIDVAVKTAPDSSYHGRVFDGYIVENGEKESLEKAKAWAREREYDREKREYTTIYEPKVYTFENKGFTATILNSAGGSSQGGRLSFWSCKIEKDGVEFTIGVNDAVLADLIRNSDISNGVVKQKVMFARKSGQPGLIHEGMESYKDAVADMAHKAAMKSAKKTTKWEIGGVYKTITQIDVCLGEVWDTMEEYQEKVGNNSWQGYYMKTKLRKREVPVKTLIWTYIYRNDEEPIDFTAVLKDKNKTDYAYINAGKPPARAKTDQLKVKKSDLKIIDQILAKIDSGEYGNRIKGRYVRELN